MNASSGMVYLYCLAHHALLKGRWIMRAIYSEVVPQVREDLAKLKREFGPPESRGHAFSWLVMDSFLGKLFPGGMLALFVEWLGSLRQGPRPKSDALMGFLLGYPAKLVTGAIGVYCIGGLQTALKRYSGRSNLPELVAAVRLDKQPVIDRLLRQKLVEAAALLNRPRGKPLPDADGKKWISGDEMEVVRRQFERYLAYKPRLTQLAPDTAQRQEQKARLQTEYARLWPDQRPVATLVPVEKAPVQLIAETVFGLATMIGIFGVFPNVVGLLGVMIAHLHLVLWTWTGPHARCGRCGLIVPKRGTQRCPRICCNAEFLPAPQHRPASRRSTWFPVTETLAS